MKKYIIGIVSFLVIWNIFYSIFLRINIPMLLVIPLLLIAFAIVLVLAKKCVAFFIQGKNKNITIGCTLIIIGVAISIACYQVSRYMPKSFENLLGFKGEEIVAIHYTYGKEDAKVITDREIIESVVQYLDDFTYHLKKESGISQDNLKANSYRLDGPFFVGKKDKRTDMKFCGYEMRSWSDYYYIEGGIVEEDKLLQLLEDE